MSTPSNGNGALGDKLNWLIGRVFEPCVDCDGYANISPSLQVSLENCELAADKNMAIDGAAVRLHPFFLTWDGSVYEFCLYSPRKDLVDFYTIHHNRPDSDIDITISFEFDAVKAEGAAVPIDDCDAYFREDVIVSISRRWFQEGFRVTVTLEVSGLLALLGQLLSHNDEGQQRAGKGSPTTQRPYPLSKAVRIVAAEHELAGRGKKKVGDQHTHKNDWPKPIPKPSRLHQFPQSTWADVTTSDRKTQWSVAA